MKKINFVTIAIILLALILPVYANNIEVGIPVLINTTSDHTYVQFDLSWDNSFRDDINWDAAWVLIKYKVGSLGEWHHAYLNTIAGNHTISEGYTCSIGLSEVSGTDRGMGVFIHRNENGSGNTSLTSVQICWEFAANGLSDVNNISLKVFTIEMVYVPQSTFFIGDADANQNKCFYKYGTSEPYLVTGEEAINIGQTDNYLWANDGGYIETSTLPAGFPKGYNAFYCMKYEISQGQYADFLNTLTLTQDANRFPDRNGNSRHTIGGTPGLRTVAVPDRACNYLTWADGIAYADWSGLRPMTELEFEKACRADLPVVDGEYAWGNDNIANWTYTLSNDGTPSATITNPASDPMGNASCMYTDGSIEGPLRCGIFATSASTRAEAGASYYGIMELSGNLIEHCVTVANSEGRSFQGRHGDGLLDSNGDASVL